MNAPAATEQNSIATSYEGVDEAIRDICHSILTMADAIAHVAYWVDTAIPTELVMPAQNTVKVLLQQLDVAGNNCLFARQLQASFDKMGQPQTSLASADHQSRLRFRVVPNT